MNAAGRHVGLVRGRLQADARAPAATRSAAPRTRTRPARSSHDYFPHHKPFQYYASTANRTTSRRPRWPTIGSTDQANHQYDLTDFDAALAAGNLPQVSFLKAIAAEDAHPGYSGPLDEQRFIVRTINAIQRRRSGTRRRSSSPTTTPTAGTTTSCPDPSRARAASSDALNGAGDCGPPAGARRLPRPLRPRPAAAADGRLALGAPELRRPHADRAGVDHALHRGQLGPRRESATNRSTRAPRSLDGMFDFDAPRRKSAATRSCSRDPASGRAWRPDPARHRRRPRPRPDPTAPKPTVVPRQRCRRRNPPRSRRSRSG